ncbi:hypothetical protein SPBR_09050 [Sporothrix brasiliensis 5110]|uniref:Uncharacterized protein n=1 Tax=Sporothrix brasiliensis 5110 TaxID=1398154 RepID=A0A0C2EU27_9PEZI|nr:uncharacterized protein SPBR_09050 [Sporothrix brasiliensis 5110]KIH90034.1 hypothetical protein SPBR_09050 [Sporothrix brasiliensis 5110]
MTRLSAHHGVLRAALLLALLAPLCPLGLAQRPGLIQHHHHEQHASPDGNQLESHVPRNPDAVCSIVRYCPDPVMSILGNRRQQQQRTTSSTTSTRELSSIPSSSCTTLHTVSCTFYTVCNLTASAPTDTCTKTTTTSSCTTPTSTPRCSSSPSSNSTSSSLPSNDTTSSTTYWVSWSSPLPTPASYSYGRLTPVHSPPWPKPPSSSSSSTLCPSTSLDGITSWPPSFATESTTRRRHHSRSIRSFHSIVRPSETSRLPPYPTTTTSSSTTSSERACTKTTTHTSKTHHSASSVFILPE